MCFQCLLYVYNTDESRVVLLKIISNGKYRREFAVFKNYF
jgi:hypothetical protein